MRPQECEWMINKSDMPEIRKRDGWCRQCGIKLSQYNLTKYCFNHQGIGQRIKDHEDKLKMAAAGKRQREINKRRYERKKNANTRTNSKGR